MPHKIEIIDEIPEFHIKLPIIIYDYCMFYGPYGCDIATPNMIEDICILRTDIPDIMKEYIKDNTYTFSCIEDYDACSRNSPLDYTDSYGYVIFDNKAEMIKWKLKHVT